MIHFSYLENSGARLAGMTDLRDGDCARSGGAEAAANRARVCEPFEVDAGGLVCGQQTHRNVIAVASEADRGRGVGGQDAFAETDGIVTTTPGVALAIFIADCVPIYLYDPVRSAAGLVHAGREGTRQEIAKAGVERMKAAFGSNPAEILAVIGPSAGPCCYEVSPEMAAACQAEGWAVSGRKLDLWRTNLNQLTAAGVPLANVKIAGICTICSGKFHSYRVSHDRRRNMAILIL
jgi:YfiH family protein